MAKTLLHKVPPKLQQIYNRTDKRNIVLYGGRGSGKSVGVADMLLLTGYQKTHRILCTREIQNSIAQSVHKLLCDRIKYLGLSSFYHITEKEITGLNGTEISFRGLYQNEESIKSMQGITICWVEEAQSISRKSLEILIPTIREPGSFLIYTMNPTNETDAAYADFVLQEREDTLKIEMNYSDNPFFPLVLRHEMERDRLNDPEKYSHVWLGQTIQHSEAQVFWGKMAIEPHEAPEGMHFYFGLDFGFSNDPNAFIRAYIMGRNLYVDYEAYGLKVDIDRLPTFLDAVPNGRENIIICDSARPETISYLRQHGYPRAEASAKGKNSVAEGIAHLRSFDKVVIHPRCKNLIQEMNLYTYVVDNRSGQITNKLSEKNNHGIDALRYAMEPVMHNSAVVVTMTLAR